MSNHGEDREFTFYLLKVFILNILIVIIQSGGISVEVNRQILNQQMKKLLQSKPESTELIMNELNKLMGLVADENHQQLASLVVRGVFENSLNQVDTQLAMNYYQFLVDEQSRSN